MASPPNGRIKPRFPVVSSLCPSMYLRYICLCSANLEDTPNTPHLILLAIIGLRIVFTLMPYMSSARISVAGYEGCETAW